MKNTSKAYTLVSKELLYRFIYFFLCFLFCLISSWAYEKELLFLYVEPLLQLHQKIIYTSISEAFYTSLRLCIWVSVASCLPYGIYQSFCFFLPSFFPTEKKNFYKYGFWVILFYVTSFLLCRVYVIPELSSWFLKFGISTQGLCLSLQAKVSNYVSWTGQLYITSLCLFQIPYSFWVLLELGLWKSEKKINKPNSFFSQNRKYISITILLLCASISPPDVYSQCTVFFLSCIIVEYVLWYSFLTQALKLKKKLKLSFLNKVSS